MDEDYDLETTDSNKSLIELLTDGLSGIQYKLFALMFISFLFLSSDVFILRFLSSFDGAVEYKTPTTWGTCIQGLLLVIAMLIFDFCIKQEIV